MRVINQSHKVYEVPTFYDLVQVKRRIEFIGRKCYQSEDKITEDSCHKFVKMLIDRKHMAMIEHSWIVLRADKSKIGLLDRDIQPFIWSNFISKHMSSKWLYICGNARAFMEALSDDSLDRSMDTLEELQAYLFNQPEHIKLLTYDEIPKELRCYSVVFITNRFVSHELVRHRPASFAQKSQRYCADKNDVDFILPWSFEKIVPEKIMIDDFDLSKPFNLCFKVWHDAVFDAEVAYHKLLEFQSPQEARTVLPNSTATEIAITADMPEWKHIFSLRCSSAADPQMQKLMIPVAEEFKNMEYM